MSKRFRLFLLVLCAVLTGCGKSSDSAEVAQTEAPQAEDSVESASSDLAPMDIVDGKAAPDRSGTYAYTGDKSSLITDGLTYFVFSQKTDTFSDDDGEPLLLEVTTETSFYSQCEAQTVWVNGLLNDLETGEVHYGQELLGYARQGRADFPDYFYCYSHYVSRGIARHDQRVISLLSQTMVYSGGAHPTTVQTAHNLDMRELTTLTLEDVILPEACQSLYALVLDRVEGKFSAVSEVVLFEDYQSVISEALTYGKMTPYWYFNDQGLVIFFNQYALAPYAAGVIKAELEYGQLDGILKEDFLPEAADGQEIVLSVSQERDSLRNVYDVTLGYGDTVYLSFNGTARQVQLSEVNLVEQTAVSSTMLFSANFLNDETALAVTGNPDPEKSYAVTYHTGSGEQTVLYYDDTIVLDQNQAQMQPSP